LESSLRRIEEANQVLRAQRRYRRHRDGRNGAAVRRRFQEKEKLRYSTVTRPPTITGTALITRGGFSDWDPKEFYGDAGKRRERTLATIQVLLSQLDLFRTCLPMGCKFDSGSGTRMYERRCGLTVRRTGIQLLCIAHPNAENGKPFGEALASRYTQERRSHLCPNAKMPCQQPG
jgi:hypothetical protein